MNIDYYMKLQNAHGTNNNRERQLAKVNRQADKHFDDTFDTEDVLLNDKPMQLMIIKDTDGNTYKKKIKSRHNDKFNIGDYVKWNNQIWMVTKVDSDEKTWNRGYMYLCTMCLRWQDVDTKEIIERWVYAEDYTKYSMGEYGNHNITVGDYQYGITIPVDKYTKKLSRGYRFVVDFDGVYPPDTYRLSGKKAFINDDRYFGRGGVMTLTLSYNFFNAEKDSLVELNNGDKAWICDYIDPNQSDTPIAPKPDEIVATIKGNNSLKIGFHKTYSVVFENQNGIIENQKFEWNVVSDFPIIQKINNNTIDLFVEDEKYISSSFLLQVIVDKQVITELNITVVPVF